MRTVLCALLVGALVSGAAPVCAQQAPASPLVIDVRLFPLEYLSNADAATLVSPFVTQGPCCGVFEAGAAVRGITVKAPRDVLQRVDSLLKANDRAPTTLTFRFQLIAAVDSAGRDPAIPGGVDSTLKDLFRFGGYRLLSQASATVESGTFSVTLSGAGAPYTISGQLGGSGRGGSGGRGAVSSPGGANAPPMSASGVRLNINLMGPMESATNNPGIMSTQYNTLLSTGLSLPIGQTVVLGSAAGNGQRRALILTVRAEVLAHPSAKR